MVSLLINCKDIISLLAPEGKAFLTLTTDASSDTIALHHPLEQKDESVLECIFEFLHDLVVPVRKPLYRTKEQDEASNDTTEDRTYLVRFLKLIKHDSTSLLNRLVYKFAWGKHVPLQDKKDSTIAQAFVASECIRGVREEQGSKFCTLLSSAMTVLSKTERFSLLKILRLTMYNITTERKNIMRKASSLLDRMKSLVLDEICYPILCYYHNLGFKNRQGVRKGMGYEQFTILYLAIITRKQLTEVNVYGPNKPSRVRREWADVRGTIGYKYKDILAPSDKDNDLFAGVVIDIYTAIMKAESEGIFPSLEKSREILDADTFRDGIPPQVWHCPQYRGRIVSEVEDDDDAVGEDVYYDNPMRQDLNKKE